MGRLAKYTARKSTASSNPAMTPFISPEIRQTLPSTRRIVPAPQPSPNANQSRSNNVESRQNRSDSIQIAQEQQAPITPIARRNTPTSRQQQQSAVLPSTSHEPRPSTSQQAATSNDRINGFVWDNEEIYSSQSQEYIRVKDNKYSARGPVDRETLAKLLAELVEDISKKLSSDFSKNKRHAKRLYISCKNVSYSDTHPSENEFLFLVELPKEEGAILTWNQAKADDIEIQIIMRLVSVPISFAWQNVEAYLDCFITDTALKRAIDSFEPVPRNRSKGAASTRRTGPRKKDDKAGDDDDEPEWLGIVVKKKK